MLDAQAAKAGAKPPVERALPHVRGFKEFINRTYAPEQEDISLNSQAAVYPLGSGTILCSPHEYYCVSSGHYPKAAAPCSINNLRNMSGPLMVR